MMVLEMPRWASEEKAMKVLVATRIPFLVFRRQGQPGAAAALFVPLTLLLWLLAAFRAMPGR